MNKKTFVACAAVIMGLACLGYFGYSYSRSWHTGIGSMDTSDKVATLDESILAKEPPVKISFGKFKDVVSVASVVSKATGVYELVQDDLSAYNSKIRLEGAIMSQKAYKKEIAVPRQFEVAVDSKTKITFPELPTSISGIAYYTMTVGACPVYTNFEWGKPNIKLLDKWIAGLKSNGFKETGNEKGSKSDKYEASIIQYSDEGRNGVFECLVQKEIATGIQSVITARLMVINRTAEKAMNNIDDMSSSIVKQILATKPYKSLGFTWRQPVLIPDYRIKNKTNAYSMAFTELATDKFPGHDAKIIESELDSWNMFPIGWACLMLESEWDKIKNDVVAEVIGKKDFEKLNLADGIKNDDGMSLKAEPSGVYGLKKERVVKVSVTDRIVDKMITDIYDDLYSAPVQMIRDKLIDSVNKDTPPEVYTATPEPPKVEQKTAK